MSLAIQKAEIFKPNIKDILKDSNYSLEQFDHSEKSYQNTSDRFIINNRRYTGSKTSLTDWILGIIKSECSGNSFTDIFAGTGSIASEAAMYFNTIIVNDFLYSNNVIYKGFFLNKKWDNLKIETLKQKYNAINSINLSQNYYSINYGDKYFSMNDALKIGFIRNDIENIKNSGLINEKEYYILLSSLLYSADKTSNTVGHYEAYFKNKNLNDKFIFKLINPVHIKDIHIHREDANILAKSLKTDIVYIDPPYNSRQYSRFYHVLETIVKNDNPKLYGTALKPNPENMSDYCRATAKDTFKNLIKNLNCKHIAVSYNNTYDSKSNSSKNKINLSDIKEILSAKGDLKIYEKKHKFFNAGKTDFNDHKELLFLVKVEA